MGFVMNTPLVSITSAFYNEEKHLLDMVRSIFAQTFNDWELLLLDDGSTDNSYKIIQSIDDPRVRVFRNERNLGRAASLNRITTLSRGKYIARMDADDICSPTRIEKQVELIESEPDVDIVGTGMCYLDKNDKPLGHCCAQPTHAQICSKVDRTFGISHGSLLGKKSWFEKNLYNESISLAIDFNLFLRTYRHSIFANVPEPLYYYRLDNSFNLKKQFTARYVSAAFLFEHYKDTGQLAKALASATIQYGKFAATVLMFATGLRKRLMNKRFESLTEDELDFYRHQIDMIKNTKLPISPGH